MERCSKSDVELSKSPKIVEMAVSKLQSRLQRSRRTDRTEPTDPFRPENYAWKKFISLDGENSTYTTVLLICMFLALLVWVFERGLLQGRSHTYIKDDIDEGVAATRLFRSLMVIITAIINGVLAFLMLALNLRDMASMPLTVSRRWLFLSVVGIVGANVFAVGIILSAHDSYRWRVDEKDSYEKPFTHYWILSVFAFFMVVMNTLYIRTVYLPFVRRKCTGWELIRRNLKAIIELGRRERGETSCCENIGYWIMLCIHKILGFVNLLIFHYFNFFESIIRWCIKAYQSEKSFSSLRLVSRVISEISLGPIRFVRWSPVVQVPLYLVRFIRRLITVPYGLFDSIIDFADVARREGHRHDASWHRRVFRGVLLFMDRFVWGLSNFQPEVQRTADELWENIKEDEVYSHSSWLKAAVVTAAILLLYFGIAMVDQFNGYMDDVYMPHRDCIINNPGVSNFFLRFIGFSPEPANSTMEDPYTSNVCSLGLELVEGDSSRDDVLANVTAAAGLNPFVSEATEAATTATGAATLTDFAQLLGERVRQNNTEDRLYHCSEAIREEDVCVMLAAVNMAEETLANNSDATRQPSDEFFDSFSGEFVYVFDVYMRNLRWTVWIGFLVGLLFGLWTLLSVMGQYKRLSLAIRSGLFTDFDLEREYQFSEAQKPGMLKRVDSIVGTRSFAKLIVQYPMSTSIFFSGMLISTAIMQLVVFGALVASVFSILASLGDSEVLSIMKPIIWTLFAFLITWLVNGPIATFVLGEGLLVSRFQVIHELFFFLFLLVFTSIHLVVGIFLAFFRMLWVLLTSLVTINRLDKNLFTYYKERDIGHKSFMALVLMQHVFHVNRSGNQSERGRWADVLQQLDDENKRAVVRESMRSKRVLRRLSELPDILVQPSPCPTEESNRMEIIDEAEQGRSPYASSRLLGQGHTAVRVRQPDRRSTD